MVFGTLWRAIVCRHHIFLVWVNCETHVRIGRSEDVWEYKIRFSEHCEKQSFADATYCVYGLMCDPSSRICQKT